MQNARKLKIVGGRLFLGGAPFDTTNMSTYFSGLGYAIYVMSQEGNLYVSSHSIGYRHHSSLLAGRNVAGAGEMQVRNGRLLWLSNKSGHYQPSVVHLLQTLSQLQKAGVPMTFSVTVLPSRKWYYSVGALLEELKLNDEPDYELLKLLTYSDYLTDDVLGTHTPHAWRWRNAGEEAGVHDAVTGSLVPHKEVRRWLKENGYVASTEVAYGYRR